MRAESATEPPAASAEHGRIGQPGGVICQANASRAGTRLVTSHLVRACTALLPSGAWAQAASGDPGVSTTAMLQTVLGLALVIGVLFLAAFLLRRLNGGRGFGSSGPLRIVGGLIVGARERIVLVEIADTWLVIGLVPGQIRTLHTLPKGELQAPSAADQRFALWLRQLSERKNEGS